MSDMSITPEQIREGRERMHLTQQQLADEVGVSRRTVTSWERGESTPQNRTAAVVQVLRLGELKDSPEFGYSALLKRLGYLAKRRREELGLSRPKFAKEIDLGSDRTLVSFEFGRHLPNGSTQRKIEKGLGWRLGSIEDVMRMVDTKASSVTMEAVDAEDSLHLAAQSGPGLALVSDEDLLAEVARRMARVPFHERFKSKDPQDLYGLAASTNSEHLEDEEGQPKDGLT